MRRLLRCLLLIFDQLWKEVLVRPLGRIGQVNMEPPSGRAFLAALEGGLWLLVLSVAV
jgi:hypothetical protein